MEKQKDEKFALPPLILASGSPRRAEILNFVGWSFEKLVPDVDESIVAGESAAEYVERLSREKGIAVAGQVENGLVLAADTTVVVDEEILGKPVDEEDARRMLRMLSGKWHQVLTGVSLIKVENGKREISTARQETGVKFATLDEPDIDFLVEYGSPLDKAGAYAVQAQAALFIEEIKGDYWNVVGLPVNLVYRLVREMGNKEMRK
ncbi:MAG TPA: Maf family protein [Pyrinomonadaceae bacterium]|jgi:septum formation protein|nr:Maf family protein [Pyrinomonadaceae bacterium]